MTEEDFETTEGESVDSYDKLKVVSSYGQCDCVGHGVWKNDRTSTGYSVTRGG